MATQIISAQAAAASRQADCLLNIMCFLDYKKVHRSLIGVIGPHPISVGLPDFPVTPADYAQALNILTTSGRISLITDPTVAFKISDDVKNAVMQSLPIEERVATFDAAVELLVVNWPFLNTHNVTDVDRLKKVRMLVPHVAALRDNCLELEPYGFLPEMDFCSLLYEQAWLETMQTTVDDMKLGCFSSGLPLAQRILAQYSDDLNHNQHVFHVVLMNHWRFKSIAASMLGLQEKAENTGKQWQDQLYMMIRRCNLTEDHRTVPFMTLELGMTALRGGNVNGAFWTAIPRARHAIACVDHLKSLGGDFSSFKWMMPKITLALMQGHCERNYGAAETLLDTLMSEVGQQEDLIFDDTTTLETGMILFAMGTVKHFSNPQKTPVLLEEALALLQRAVRCLKQTHGEEAIWTLAATYRTAVCLFDLKKYSEAVTHLTSINHTFQKYKPVGITDDAGADILWQKARAMWKCGRALQEIGDEKMATEAKGLIDGAVKIWWDICGTPANGDTMDDAAWDDRILPLHR